MPNEIFGQGAYTVSQAAKLISVSYQRLRRWFQGYSYVHKRKRVNALSVWRGDWAGTKQEGLLTFRDMIEARFIIELRARGISWKSIRVAADQAREALGTNHPFSSQKIGTLDKRIFARVPDPKGGESLFDLVTKCYALDGILNKYIRDLEYSEADEVIRWYPLHDRNKVVLDPKRQFGQPIVAKEGVQTAVLYAAYQAENSVERVAAWYDVSRASVQSAIDFEESIAA
ncbi:MAG: DUF433 domain-containing protein [Planctomycetota bacterium]